METDKDRQIKPNEDLTVESSDLGETALWTFSVR